MTDSTGIRSTLPWILILLAAAACAVCACCAVGGVSFFILSYPATLKPEIGSTTRPAPTLSPTVNLAPDPASATPAQTVSEAFPTAGADSEPDSWRSMGDPDAPVVVEDFADFQCPCCGQFFSNSEARLREEYVETGKVRFIFRNYPIVDSYVSNGTESTLAALAALCAGEQGDFWEYHDLLFENQSGENERPRGKPRGITERNPQEHAQQAAGYSSSRKNGIKARSPLPGYSPSRSSWI